MTHRQHLESSEALETCTAQAVIVGEAGLLHGDGFPLLPSLAPVYTDKGPYPIGDCDKLMGRYPCRVLPLSFLR
jgi:hypothetical protein